MGFHAGELSAQFLAGTRGAAHELGQYVGSELRGADSLLEKVRVAWVASLEARAGGQPRVWVSPVFGRAGFMRADSPTRLSLGLHGHVAPGDKLWENLRRPGPHPVGFVAMDLEHRRRYRTNGVVETAVAPGQERLEVRVKEAFPNCPKYIQKRVVDDVSGALDAVPLDGESTETASLTEEDVELIRRSDTFFLGTYFEGTGVDSNHRGGRPGFVRVNSPSEISWGDYRGNGMFMSFGNLEENSAAGVVFLDFDSGRVVQLTGRAEVQWGVAPGRDMESAAERVVKFRVDGVRRSTGAATNYRWKLLEISPYNPALPTDAGARAGADFPLDLELVKTWDESRHVKSFRFLAPRRVFYLPGQYGTFEFPGGTFGESAPVVRTWTLSEAATSMLGDVTLEISVKKKDRGVVSTWLHENARIGELKVRLLGIGGGMTPFDKESVPRKFLLLSGGIGATPNVAIVRGFGRRPSGEELPDVVYLHQERRARDTPFVGELTRRANGSGGRMRLVVLESGDGGHDGGLQGVDVEHGRISDGVLRRLVPDVAERAVYLCGPPGFMGAAVQALSACGVRESDIVSEAFDF